MALYRKKSNQPTHQVNIPEGRSVSTLRQEKITFSKRINIPYTLFDTVRFDKGFTRTYVYDDRRYVILYMSV